MTTDRFTLDEFKAALPPETISLGLVGDEYAFRLPFDTQVSVEIRSSIDASGLAAEAGEDSIRLWLINQHGVPLAGKLQRWTTRQPGWDKRLLSQIERLRQLRKSAGNCPVCKQPRRIIKAKTPQNNGRLFASCEIRDHKSFKWLDVQDDDPVNYGGAADETLSDTPGAPAAERTMVARRDSACPVCGLVIKAGATIALREGRWMHNVCPSTKAPVQSQIRRLATQNEIDTNLWEHDCDDDGGDSVLKAIGEDCSCGELSPMIATRSSLVEVARRDIERDLRPEGDLYDVATLENLAGGAGCENVQSVVDSSSRLDTAESLDDIAAKSTNARMDTIISNLEASIGSFQRNMEATSLATGQAAASVPPLSSSLPGPEHNGFKPSTYQQAIFEFVFKALHNDPNSPGGHAVIEAVAGSGKTTTGIKALGLVPSNLKAAFVAFNKHIAREIKDRGVPQNVDTGTLHSMGLRSISAVYPGIKVDAYKKRKILDQMISDWPAREEMLVVNGAAILRLVSLLGQTMRPFELESIEYLAERYGVDLADGMERETIIWAIGDVIQRAKVDRKTIDFDEMCTLCAEEVRPIQYDVLFGDESQDFNAAQLAMLLRMLKPGGHLIAIGDRHQSLYGFRGADTDAIPNIISATNAIQLPLSISYRCPIKHVELAQRLVPEIQPRDDAPVGIVDYIHMNRLLREVQQGDLIICRTNAPLIAPAFALIRQGVKATIAGRDIGEGVVSFVTKIAERYGTDDVYTLISGMEEFVGREVPKLLAAKKENQALLMQDQYDTVLAISEGATKVAEVIQRLRLVFSDDAIGVRFSSVHRAKGMESDRVYILRPDLMPYPMASQEWEQVQEANVEYVALTRSKSELYFVEGK